MRRAQSCGMFRKAGAGAVGMVSGPRVGRTARRSHFFFIATGSERSGAGTHVGACLSGEAQKPEAAATAAAKRSARKKAIVVSTSGPEI